MADIDDFLIRAVGSARRLYKHRPKESKRHERQTNGLVLLAEAAEQSSTATVDVNDVAQPPRPSSPGLFITEDESSSSEDIIGSDRASPCKAESLVDTPAEADKSGRQLFLRLTPQGLQIVHTKQD